MDHLRSRVPKSTNGLRPRSTRRSALAAHGKFDLNSPIMIDEDSEEEEPIIKKTKSSAIPQILEHGTQSARANAATDTRLAQLDLQILTQEMANRKLKGKLSQAATLANPACEALVEATTKLERADAAHKEGEQTILALRSEENKAEKLKAEGKDLKERLETIERAMLAGPSA